MASYIKRSLIPYPVLADVSLIIIPLDSAIFSISSLLIALYYSSKTSILFPARAEINFAVFVFLLN